MLKVSLTAEAPFVGNLLCARKKANLVQRPYIGGQSAVYAECFPVDNLVR